MISYLKETLEDFELIFYPEFKPTYFEQLPVNIRRNTVGFFKDVILENCIIWFQTGNGEEDTLTFLDIKDSGEKSLPNKIHIGYQKIINEIGINKFFIDLERYIKNDAHNYMEYVFSKLGQMQTNVMADSFLKENFYGLKGLIDSVEFLLRDESLCQNQIKLLSAYQKSYRNTFLIFKEKFGLTYDKLFNELMTSTENQNTDFSHRISKFPNGLILSKGIRITPKIASRLSKHLKEGEFIEPYTKADTISNIFQTVEEPVLSQVIWTAQNHHLKYFINQLYEKGLIRESRYQFKWKDVANCFVNSNGDLYGPQSFSKNTEKPKDKIKRKIDSIVDKFYWDFDKKVSY